jgi:hypothetical protein
MLERVVGELTGRHEDRGGLHGRLTQCLNSTREIGRHWRGGETERRLAGGAKPTITQTPTAPTCSNARSSWYPWRNNDDPSLDHCSSGPFFAAFARSFTACKWAFASSLHCC